ncbi:uncharacterized protein LOC121732368 [Aricia agestis]|uniref:uncharacterized protein LOC121732368 n=1 Tax=Aricia agestis TaxID=91739 RepID=UPI001C201CED|nr:uncharacterized protein LOC121732368 [Aricia agestis]XP_041978165.1 uncharacterized protein LOC121732368 [Aricia agestis]
MSVPPCNQFPERLYLSKGDDGDVYVDNCRILRKNQIDGLRGLYKVFKKKNPGVILNDASNSGKTVLVSLFIASIQSLLDNPVLILCQENHEIEYWKEILLKWTKYTEDDISINSTNPYLKKNVFIQSMDLSNSYYRRCWSVLILKNDKMTKEIGKMVFEAEFRIWITSMDVFKDLTMLLSVSKFINPSITINTADFEISNKNIRQKLKTLVLLDTFTKDLVVRTDHLKSILMNTNVTNTSVSSASTKKNKDASGTKIKKSKRKVNDEEPSKCSKKAAKKIKTKFIDDDEDSPSLISFTYNKTMEINFTQNNIEDDTKADEFTNENIHNDHENITHNVNVLETNADIPNDEDSTQSLTGMNENLTNNDNEIMSDIKVNNIEHEEMSFKHTQNNIITSNKLNNSRASNEIEMHDEIYDKETIDLNVDTSQIKLNYTEDANMEQDEVKTNTELQNEIVKSDSASEISNEIEMTNDKSHNSIPNTQVAENIQDAIDRKINDLEMRALMKFKGSFLDSIF